MGRDLQSCPEVQTGASGPGLSVVPAVGKPWMDVPREKAEESTRLLTASQCQAAALKGL